MRPYPSYIIAVSGGAVAAICFAIGLEVSANTAGLAAGPSVDFGTSAQVNRALKGDRLRLIVRPPGVAPPDVQVPGGSSPKLLDGCESAFGQMEHSATSAVPHRCVT